MKSQHKENTVRTNCKDCAFAIYDQNCQKSCVFGRIEKFDKDVIEAHDNDKEFYVINRLCTYYRSKLWGYSENDVEKVQQESAISFDIIFDCDNINDAQSQIIIHFINNHKYYKNKVNFVLLHEYQNHESAKGCISKIARDSKQQVNITMCSKIEYQIHQLIMKSKHGYHAIIKYPELLELNVLHSLNNYVNHDLNKLVIANICGTHFIGNFVYKILNSINNSHAYFENIDTIIEDAKNKNMYTEI